MPMWKHIEAVSRYISASVKRIKAARLLPLCIEHVYAPIKICLATLVLLIFSFEAVSGCPPYDILYKKNPIIFHLSSWNDGLNFFPVAARNAILGDEGSYAEIAVIDLNGDNFDDRIIRFLSPAECGSHGCSTYFAIYDTSYHGCFRVLPTNTITPPSGVIHLLFSNTTRKPAGLLFSHGSGFPEKEYYWSFHFDHGGGDIGFECSKSGFISQ